MTRNDIANNAPAKMCKVCLASIRLLSRCYTVTLVGIGIASGYVGCIASGYASCIASGYLNIIIIIITIITITVVVQNRHV